MPLHQVSLSVPVWERLAALQDKLGMQFGGAPKKFSYSAVLGLLLDDWDARAERGDLPSTGFMKEVLEGYPKRGRKVGAKNREKE